MTGRCRASFGAVVLVLSSCVDSGSFEVSIVLPEGARIPDGASAHGEVTAFGTSAVASAELVPDPPPEGEEPPAMQPELRFFGVPHGGSRRIRIRVEESFDDGGQ